MPEQIVSSAASAVTSEAVRILFSGIVGRIYRKAVAADKKLRRLKLLLIKIHSAVEASEKHAVENAWLLEWRDTLKEAAAEGDEVLAGFRQRQRASTDDAARGPAGDDDARHQQQEQERPSSSSSTTASAATAKAPSSSGSARSTRGPTETRRFSTDEDMERLNSVVERLEELSPEIGMFVKLLKLEILTPEQATAENRARYLKRARPARHSSRCEPHGLEILTPEQRSMENTESMRFAKRTRPSASGGNEPSGFKLFGCSLNAGEPGIAALVPAPGTDKEGSEESCRKTPTTGETVDATTQEEQERSTTLVDRFEEAFAAICRTVEVADGRDLRGRQWLARWASMLREAKARGCAVLGAISARRSATVATDTGSHRRCSAEATAVDSTSLPDDWDDYELGRFVCGMESLAGEVDYFAGLACLCPSY